MRRFLFLLVLALAGCGVPAGYDVYVAAEDWNPSAPAMRDRAETFRQVSRAVGNAARAECARQPGGRNCDFVILVDLDPFESPNAFQTLDKSGRPLIIFTQKMIKSARNGDEMAFVMGHEAAHHILGHIARQLEYQKEAARIFGEEARAQGAGPEEIDLARELGAEVGRRSYTKQFELEADRMGTVITYAAGYDPLVGMAYFGRIPDPGDRFFASHPPNARRVEAVLETVTEMGLIQ
ncbi:peptidase, M48 family [Ruegeria lacuscaerulensis ITI-1157]|nr:peptidase, M48 family [Ruegeria lacuscaerulensis ITI-1157]SHI91300.1 Peptidase family M48 [Ruegeria lacuscaerulensis ITI-1157]